MEGTVLQSTEDEFGSQGRGSPAIYFTCSLHIELCLALHWRDYVLELVEEMVE